MRAGSFANFSFGKGGNLFGEKYFGVHFTAEY